MKKSNGSYSKNENRRRNLVQSLDYNQLEERQVLTSMLYVDFGMGAEDITVFSDAEMQTVNGPEIFGDGTTLLSFQQGVIDNEIDFNRDGIIDGLDSNRLARQVVNNLRQIFKPFDVDVKWINSENLAEMRDVLVARPEQDAYIFVGGRSPMESLDFGAAVIDADNSEDNLGVVFAENVFDFFNPVQCFDYCSGQGLPASWFLARNIAKQAGHTFGLQSTDAGEIAAANDVMSLAAGVDDEGNRIDRSNHNVDAFFARVEMQMVGDNVNTQNSFELLGQNVGLRADQPYFYTGAGGSDDIVVNHVAGGVIMIMNGDTATVLTQDEIADGLIIDTGLPPTSDFADRVSVSSDVEIDVEVRNAGTLSLLEPIVQEGGPANQWRVVRSNVQVVGDTLVYHHGTINQNVSFTNVNSLEGNSGKDVFRFMEDDSLFVSYRVYGFTGGPVVNASGNGGNDLFIVDSHAGNIRGDEGNDQFRIYEAGQSTGIDGGAGFDIVDFSNSQIKYQTTVTIDDNGEFELKYAATTVSSPNLLKSARTALTTAERIMGSPVQHDRITGPSSGDPNDQLKTVWVVDGNKTTLLDNESGARVELFGGVSTYVGNTGSDDWFYVKSTANDTSFHHADHIQFSSEFDPLLGDLEGILHEVHLSGDLNNYIVNPHVTLGAGGGSGESGMIAADLITGLTDKAISMEGYKPMLTVHGSQTSADKIAISGTARATRVYTYGGDDLVTVGYADSREDSPAQVATLNHMNGMIKIDTGEGNDQLKVEHRAGTGMNFHLQPQYLRSTDANAIRTSFAGLHHMGAEHVRLFLTTSLGNNFHYVDVAGSASTYYEITTFDPRGEEELRKTDDLLRVSGDPSDRTFIPADDATEEEVANGTADGTWVFNSSLQSISIDRYDPRL